MLKTCKVYSSCKAVPNGEFMNECQPSYTSKGSKNWTKCNMSNWPEFSHYKKFCKSQKRCKKVKNVKPSEDQVDVNVLHSKMPYIWRFLDRKTRRKIVKLARRPLDEINV